MTVTEVRRPRRGFDSLADMGRSLGLMVLVIGVTLLVVPGLFRPSKSQRFPAVDYSAELTGFTRVTGRPVLAPTPVPAGWQANAARMTGTRADAHLHIGWAVPGDRYAGLEESVAPATSFVPAVLGARGGTVTGSVDIAGAPWQTRTSSRGEPAFTRTLHRVTVVVTGSATPAQLRALAAALH